MDCSYRSIVAAVLAVASFGVVSAQNIQGQLGVPYASGISHESASNQLQPQYLQPQYQHSMPQQPYQSQYHQYLPQQSYQPQQILTGDALTHGQSAVLQPELEHPSNTPSPVPGLSTAILESQNAARTHHIGTVMRSNRFSLAARSQVSRPLQPQTQQIQYPDVAPADTVSAEQPSLPYQQQSGTLPMNPNSMSLQPYEQPPMQSSAEQPQTQIPQPAEQPIQPYQQDGGVHFTNPISTPVQSNEQMLMHQSVVQSVSPPQPRMQQPMDIPAQVQNPGDRNIAPNAHDNIAAESIPIMPASVPNQATLPVNSLTESEPTGPPPQHPTIAPVTASDPFSAPSSSYAQESSSPESNSDGSTSFVQQILGTWTSDGSCVASETCCCASSANITESSTGSVNSVDASAQLSGVGQSCYGFNNSPLPLTFTIVNATTAISHPFDMKNVWIEATKSTDAQSLMVTNSLDSCTSMMYKLS